MLARTQRLFTFDRALGSRLVAGADEAGRGCLAGPLVAAAVLIDYGSLSRSDRLSLAGLHDSKQMDVERREEIYPAVLRAAARASIVIRCVRGIDDRGLHVTNLEALSSALERLRPEADATCLVDGFSLRRCAVPHRAVVEGDGTSAAIAAASVLAKVTRDRYMHGIAAAAPGLGIRRARRLLDPRAPGGDRADRDLTAAPPLVPVGRLQPARARLTGASRRPRSLACGSRTEVRSPCRPPCVLDLVGQAPRIRMLTDVLDREVRPGAVEGDAEDVEADLGVAGGVASGRHPGGGDAADPVSLARADRQRRALGAEIGALATGLDLDEDQRAAVDRDDVDLAEAGAGVALDDPPAGRREPGRDQVLGPAPDSLAREWSSPPTLGAGRARVARRTQGQRHLGDAAAVAARKLHGLLDLSEPLARRGRPSSAPCSPPRGPSPSTGSRPGRSGSRSTSGAACPHSPWWGLPDAAVREARERVRAAITNCGFEFPLRRIVANLAPASVRKAGPGLDLPMAAALLTASGQLDLVGAATGGDGRRARPRRLGPPGPWRAGGRPRPPARPART